MVRRATRAPRPYADEAIYSGNGKFARVEYTYWNSAGGVSHGTIIRSRVAASSGGSV